MSEAWDSFTRDMRKFNVRVQEEVSGYKRRIAELEAQVAKLQEQAAIDRDFIGQYQVQVAGLTREKHEVALKLSQLKLVESTVILRNSALQERCIKLEVELAQARAERDRERVNFKAIIDDVFDGMECLTECADDPDGHADGCPTQVGLAAFRSLRKQLAQARDECAIKTESLAELWDLSAELIHEFPQLEGKLLRELFLGVIGQLRSQLCAAQANRSQTA